MPEHNNTSKWLITYQGKPYLSVYGKRKAYDLYFILTACVQGLRIERAPKKQAGPRTQQDMNEYWRQWRAKNKEKVQQYNRRNYLKRKFKESGKEGELMLLTERSQDRMDSYSLYLKWTRADMPQWMKDELRGLAEKEIQERFGSRLQFGTGGLRAEIGAGTNRMNVFTVRRTTQGLAEYLRTQEEGSSGRSVAIAYDSRRYSREFAEEAALVLANNGIRAYVFEELRPTPMLSYAVRYLKASAGIVITASHNPPEYNGYKVYGSDGAQLPPAASDEVTAAVAQTVDELEATAMSKEEAIRQGLLLPVPQEVEESYYQEQLAHLQGLTVPRGVKEQLSIVYTPLHGTGNKPVRTLLERAGFTQVHIVSEQELPDSEFSTVGSPNPEEQAALQLAMDKADQLGGQLVLGTDPDADRVGIAVRTATGKYECLNGNQTGALIVHYLLQQKKAAGQLPDNGVVIKTIVTSELGRAIASSYGITVLDVLTGFKYIGEKIREYEQTGEKQFIFGYEESYGCLAGQLVRDKDAVQACLIIAEMAAYYHSRGMSLLDALTELYEKYGYYKEGLHSITLKGLDGMEQMNQMISSMRELQPAVIGPWKVEWIRDYERGFGHHVPSNMELATGLPSSNVLHYTMTDGSWFAVRPSGTEPKLKLYFSVVGSSEENSIQKLQLLKESVLQLMK